MCSRVDNLFSTTDHDADGKLKVDTPIPDPAASCRWPQISRTASSLERSTQATGISRDWGLALDVRVTPLLLSSLLFSSSPPSGVGKPR